MNFWIEIDSNWLTHTIIILFGSLLEGEIDYVKVLNRALPKDIRIIGWCPVPNDFNARFFQLASWSAAFQVIILVFSCVKQPVVFTLRCRFSCLSREYKYFFWSGNLNLPVCRFFSLKFITFNKSVFSIFTAHCVAIGLNNYSVLSCFTRIWRVQVRSLLGNTTSETYARWMQQTCTTIDGV